MNATRAHGSNPLIKESIKSTQPMPDIQQLTQSYPCLLTLPDEPAAGKVIN